MCKKWIYLFFGLCFISGALAAQPRQDTLRLPLAGAEKMFIDSNLQLLAQRYNIDASQALILQARLWPNPNFQVSHGLYSGALQKFFPTGANDETTLGLSQLILLAGKRNKQVQLAQESAHLSEYQFFDLLRTLKYTLRTDFFQIYYLQQSSRVYDEEIKALSQVVNAFSQQQGKGYISEKEVVRIKAQLYSFQSEYSDLINQVNKTESELRLVLQVKPNFFIEPVVDSMALTRLDPSQYSLTQLIDSAYHNRTDLQIAKANTRINQLNYYYQKALAVPDLTLNLGYDEAGSYLTSYYGIGASIDLPFFNRNQGNIKSAKSQIASSEAIVRSTRATVEENVTSSLQKAFAQQKLFQTVDPKFYADFQRLMHEMLINYQKRNISILEFLDFYDSYKQNTLQLNTIGYNRVSAFEDINYYTGTNFFN
ncbi:TolC family protein [Puia sp.]|jgi:cobalt-zinc-cadmium efflux system outer membrane protein|uniref:TolC family protein n=1 Tax=Puia sp. TaxID=2045100 RepID=UPI002F3EEE88